MKVSDFVNKLKLALSEPTFYQSGGWGKWNGQKWGFDCNNLGKAIIWQWRADRSKPKGGGAIYCSNGLGDIGTETMIAKCSNVSSDFSNLKVGELLWMQGHVGYYIGNGEVIEATTAFGGGVVQSKINAKGQRLNYKTGANAGPDWKKHGLMPWIEYDNEPQPQPSSFLPPRGYFKKGDISANVGKIAEFMYKTFPVYTSKAALGDLYGDNLIRAIKQFQTNAKKDGVYDDVADGYFGPKTLKALEYYGFKY